MNTQNNFRFLVCLAAVLVAGSLLAVQIDLPTINSIPSLFGTDAETPNYNVVRPVHVGTDGALKTEAVPEKVGQPVFNRVAIATNTATLLSSVIAISSDAIYLYTFEQACYFGPATTTASVVIASGTKMAAGTQIRVSPGSAIDAGIVADPAAVASFSAIKWPIQ